MLKGDWQSFGKSLAQAFKDVYRSDLVASHKSEMVKPTVDPPKKPRMSIDLEKKVTEERLRSKITSCTSKNNSKLPLKIPELGNKKDEKRDNSFELLSHISTSQELSKNRRFERLTEKFTREKRERLERVGDMNRIGPLEMMGLDKLGKGDNRLQREMLRTKFKVRKQS